MSYQNSLSFFHVLNESKEVIKNELKEVLKDKLEIEFNKMAEEEIRWRKSFEKCHDPKNTSFGQVPFGD